MKKITTFLAILALGALLAPTAFATNGMNLEGYGPVAHAMGGASMAYDNGSAALMNNPATLGFLADGASYLNLAVGLLGPNVTSEFAAMSMTAESAADAFYMPAVGYIRRGGDFTYGFGVFGQGGMGTDYPDDSFLAGPTGSNAFSQVSVGRAMVPVAYQVNEKLTFGATADFIWGGMDIKMAMPIGDGGAPSPGSFMDFMGSHVLGEATPSAGMGTAINDMIVGDMLHADDYALISFADDSDFSGAASGTGFAAKLGFVYQATPKVAVGGTYHLKTAMGDWEADEATMSFFEGDGSGLIGGAMKGKMVVEDFQWPATLAFGLAYQHCEKLFLVADYKLIQWAAVMENFKMVFEVTDDASPLKGETVAMTMYQNWEDQSVIQFGAAFAVTAEYTPRGGAAIATTPLPDECLPPLSPPPAAHPVPGGAGFVFGDNPGVDVSFAFAPEVEQENTNTTVSTKHSQFNWQLMYSFGF